MPKKKKKPEPLFGLRVVVVMEAAVIVGVISGWLSYMLTPVLPGAVGAGLAAGCMSVVLLHRLIDKV